VYADYLEGFIWLRVAELGGCKFSGDTELIKIMINTIDSRLTSSQLETAQKLDRECVRKKYKGC
jgi:hypothetical protein